MSTSLRLYYLVVCVASTTITSATATAAAATTTTRHNNNNTPQQQQVVQLSAAKSGLTLHLPRVCQWYEKDWGSPTECAKAVVRHLPPDKQQLLRAALGQDLLSIKYLPADFRCSPLVLLDDCPPGDTSSSLSHADWARSVLKTRRSQ